MFIETEVLLGVDVMVKEAPGSGYAWTLNFGHLTSTSTVATVVFSCLTPPYAESTNFRDEVALAHTVKTPIIPDHSRNAREDNVATGRSHVHPFRTTHIHDQKSG
ncbi:hypothetical protein Bbelb_272340 [Branchiostoma belcheri]|nr:hypothetical protein Bbelb_272340 [Branchiostoma belcheri]